METKSIIFDLYDTLIYCPDEFKTNPYKKFFSELGLTKDQMKYWKTQIITNNFNSFESILEKINPNIEIDLDKYRNLLQDELMSVRLFDDTLSTLERLSSKYRIFCLSNLATPYKSPYFELGIDKFIEKPFFSCDLGDSKPNKSFFNMVVEYSGLSSKEFIMIGDNLKSDYEGGLNAGIKSILKNNMISLICKDL